jgi:c-di-GMP-binding flagellar brake protein YcgR
MKRYSSRKYPRVEVNLPVDYTKEGDTTHARLLTLGGGGLFLGVAEPLALGTELSVRFRPARHLPVVQAKARVRYQLPGQGIGIEFTDISPEHREMVLRLILRRISEQRRFPRIPFATQIEHEGGVFIGFSRDISAGGMFIETKEPISAGSKLKLRFHLDDVGPVVIATGEVRYTVLKLGIGVLFVDLEPDDRRRIDVFVREGEVST